MPLFIIPCSRPLRNYNTLWNGLNTRIQNVMGTHGRATLLGGSEKSEQKLARRALGRRDWKEHRQERHMTHLKMTK